MSEAKEESYEKSHSLSRLGLAFSIVNDGQAGAVVSILEKAGASASFISHGNGTAKNDLYDVLGFGEDRKQAVLSILKEEDWKKAKPALSARFAVSQFAKGVAFYSYLSSVCGVSAYRFVANVRNEKPWAKGESTMEEKPMKANYEVIFAIVNDGFTDLVMAAARKAGARGGTIITARGTGNKEMEKFFGVVITPEKQIVMILVKKEIKDAVLSAIYKDVNINAKGQGIAFSISANDVVGLAPEEGEGEEEEKEVQDGAPKDDNKH